MIPGVDVSSFNGPPADWRKVAGKISWAGVKISEYQPGGVKYVNPDAAADWSALSSLGKGRLAYMFGHPSTSAADSVALFIGTLGPLGIEDGDAVALDLEVTDGHGAAAVAAWAADVLALLERDLDRGPLLYSFIDFIDAGNCAGLEKYRLWLADPSSPAGHPRVPAPWKTWTLHQFSSAGDLDRDVANYANLSEFRHALGKAAPVARVADYETNGRESLAEIARAHGVGSMHVLRLTVLRDSKFAAGLAAYGNGVFSGTVEPSAVLPAGLVLRVPVLP